MANVVLYVDDVTTALTLQALIESAGHRVVPEPGEVVIADRVSRAVREAAQRPTLLLTTAAELPSAIEAMRRGVYGYLLVPFVPGEAGVMVDRCINGFKRSDAPVPKGEAGDEAWPTLEEVETRHILATLERFRNNHSKAARVLGIGRNTLWRKMKKIRVNE